jgi:ankyrin repeat protein
LIASQNGFIEKARFLLKHSTLDVDEKNYNEDTPLHLALRNGYQCIGNMLIQKLANFNEKGQDEETPLHLISEEGHKDIVELLIKTKVNVNGIDDRGMTPLHCAANNGRYKNRDIVDL